MSVVFARLFGKSRQAFYARQEYYNEQFHVNQIVLELVSQIRRDLPGLGTKKLYLLLREPFKTHGIKMGRDKLHELLTRQGMLIRRRKGAPKTTNSRHWMKNIQTSFENWLSPDQNSSGLQTSPTSVWGMTLIIYRLLQMLIQRRL